MVRDWAEKTGDGPNQEVTPNHRKTLQQRNNWTQSGDTRVTEQGWSRKQEVKTDTS